MAIEAGVPIVPVGIAGSDEAMPAKSWWIRPGPLRFEVGQPIIVTGYTFEQRDVLSTTLQRAVQELKIRAASSLS